MSHTTKITSIAIKNLKALEAAVAELARSGVKITMEEGGRPRAYFDNQSGMGDAVKTIRLSDARYDIGIYKDADGNYEARTDFFGGSVEKVLGADKKVVQQFGDQARLGRLYQAYTVNASEMEARARGLTVRRQAAANGVVQLVISGNRL